MKVKNKVLIYILVILLICCTFSGCKSQTLTLVDRNVVQGIGIDYNDGKYNLTMHFSSIKSESPDDVDVVTSQGNSVKEAIDNTTMITGKTPLLNHSVLVILGNECAKRGINEVLDYFVRNSTSNGRVIFSVAGDTAAEILNTKDKDKNVSARQIKASIESEQKNGRSSVVDVMQIVSRLNSNCGVYLPLVRTNGTVVFAGGTAYFSNDKLSGILTDSDTRSVEIGTNKIDKTSYIFDIDDIGKVTLEIQNVKTDIKSSIVNNTPLFTMYIDGNADISSVDSKENKAVSEKNYEVFERVLCARIEKNTEDVFHITAEKKSDIFRLNRILEKQQTNYWRNNTEYIQNNMTDFKFTVICNIKLSRTGNEISPVD